MKMNPYYYLALPFVLWLLLWFFMPRAKAQEVHYVPVPAKPEEPVTIPRLKAAIRAVENTPWDAVGRCGERSAYQIMRDTWKMWSLKPFEWASNYDPMCVAETETVMSRHLAYIKGVLTRGGYVHNVYSVALLYKGGEHRWAENRMRREDVEYARRVDNIYADAK